MPIEVRLSMLPAPPATIYTIYMGALGSHMPYGSAQPLTTEYRDDPKLNPLVNFPRGISDNISRVQVEATIHGSPCFAWAISMFIYSVHIR